MKNMHKRAPSRHHRVMAGRIVLSFAALSAAIPLVLMVISLRSAGSVQPIFKITPRQTSHAAPQLILHCAGSDKKSVSFGDRGATIFGPCLLTANNADIQVSHLRFTLSGNHVNMLVGTSGTHYFVNLKVRNVGDGSAVMGPLELPNIPGTRLTTLDQHEAFFLPAGHSMTVALTADISHQEDAPGQFFGKSYRVLLADLTPKDVCVTENNASCQPDAPPVTVEHDGLFDNAVIIVP